MADYNQNTPWPIKFYFKVTIGDKGTLSFQEVSGLDVEHKIIEYRQDDRPEFSNTKPSDFHKSSDVTFKKGVFIDNSTLFDYFNEVKMNIIKKQTVTIQLLDEKDNPMFTCTLRNALPIKITGTDLKLQNSEAVIEELVLAHEGLTIENA